jgi:pyruvate,water dikinase
VSSDVRGLHEVDRTQVALVGGKGAHLGELAHLHGIRVPAGFCVTTDAFRRVVGGAPSVADQLDRLSQVRADDHGAIRALSAELRRTVERLVIPDDVATAITRALSEHGAAAGWAVRSSATAEDLPSASFAGLHDTYLNVVGSDSVLEHVSRCWASLFTERAVAYRLRNRYDHRAVEMGVVVQEMVRPRAAGVLFTADPVTSNRHVASVEAVFGIGEALVAGRVESDVFKVRDGVISATRVATKQRAVRASPGGGTEELPIEPSDRDRPALTDEQVVDLVALGRKIEAEFGSPQDIEWCLVDDGFVIVQSRAITTLFPIPDVSDGGNHVYISVGHQQMMTDPMKPLGISMWQLTAARPMFEAGSRLFVDVTQALASPASRSVLLEMAGRSDPLIRDALETVLARDDLLLPRPAEVPASPPPGAAPAPLEIDRTVVAELISRNEASLAALQRDIRDKAGPALLDFILVDVQELRRLLFEPRSHQVIMAGMEASWWLDEHLRAWLGDEGAADALSQSVPDNVTAEMGLSLLDVADVIRPHPEVVTFLEGVVNDDFLDQLGDLDGGRAARDGIRVWLDRYGMRCVGEIDITRPRWSERPAMLLPMLLASIRGVEPGAAERRFEHGRLTALRKEHEVLERLRALPDGDRKAAEAKQAIDRVRTFAGYREYPKYGMVCRYAIYRQALLAEADRLVRAGVLADREDIYFLRFEEIRAVVGTGQVDRELIRRRRHDFRSHESLRPPRVLTSEGEAIDGAYRRDGDLPPGALIGLAVSAGTVEGRARVVLDVADADVAPGDILVTTHTDPSWAPLFVAVAGLVTEVGGLMTHGAVIAREYGLPAVVGVRGATQLVRDGQRIRVDGTAGYVEVVAAD